MKPNYRLRRLVAAIILLGIFMAFTVSVLIKTNIVGRAIDSEFARQDAIMQEHFKTWGNER